MALLVTVFAFSFSAEIQAKSVSKNKEVVDVIFILDRSGSMGGLESDTIGGFNSVLEKQRKEEVKHILQQFCLTINMNCYTIEWISKEKYNRKRILC